MNLLTMENLTKSYTERLVFDHTAFSLGTGEKVGIIGINGTGKKYASPDRGGAGGAGRGNCDKRKRASDPVPAPDAGV